MKKTIIFVLTAVIISIGLFLLYFYRVRFTDEHSIGFIVKKEDEGVEAVIYTSVHNGTFSEKKITFAVGGGDEYQNGYLENDMYDIVQIEIERGYVKNNDEGAYITIPRGETVNLTITAKNEYIGNENTGETIFLKRAAPEEVKIVTVH